MAGVLFQQLLVEATPATKDQEHLQVVCFTDPTIPDRTVSLRDDDGRAYSDAVIESLQLLEKAGVTLGVMTCNTAHARFARIQESTTIPLVHIIESTLDHVHEIYGGGATLGLLATDGTINSNLFQETRKEYGFRYVTPGAEDQAKVMEIIYGIKAGRLNKDELRAEISRISEDLIRRGASKVILGCTELSLLYKKPKDLGNVFIEPLRILARRVVSLSQQQMND